MKKIPLILLINIIVLNIFGQKIMIDRNYKFSRNDSTKFSTLDYQDSTWQNLKSTLWWGQSGVKHSGYAWYRKKVFIPKSLPVPVPEPVKDRDGDGVVDSLDNCPDVAGIASLKGWKI